MVVSSRKKVKMRQSSTVSAPPPQYIGANLLILCPAPSAYYSVSNLFNRRSCNSIRLNKCWWLSCVPTREKAARVTIPLPKMEHFVFCFTFMVLLQFTGQLAEPYLPTIQFLCRLVFCTGSYHLVAKKLGPTRLVGHHSYCRICPLGMQVIVVYLIRFQSNIGIIV